MQKGSPIEEVVTVHVTTEVRARTRQLNDALASLDVLLGDGQSEIGVTLGQRIHAAFGHSINALSHLQGGAYTEAIEDTNQLIASVEQVSELLVTAARREHRMVKLVEPVRPVEPVKTMGKSEDTPKREETTPSGEEEDEESERKRRPRARRRVSDEERKRKKREYNRRYAARKKAEREAQLRNG